jgi:hypothetical protein
LAGWAAAPQQPQALGQLSPPSGAAPPLVPRGQPAAVEVQISWARLPWAQPAPQAPPVRTQSVPAEVLIGWLPPRLADWAQPLVAVNLEPPIGGPAPQAPPVRVQTVPAEILIAWLPPAPQPIAGFTSAFSGATRVTTDGGLPIESLSLPALGPGPVIRARADRVLLARPDRVLAAAADLKPKQG